MPRFEIDTDYLLQVLEDIINTPSPTGDTEWAVGFVENELQAMDLPTERTGKGALISRIDGLESERPRAITAHVDTLGAVVREIKPNGRLKMRPIGGVNWPSVESEGVTIRSRGDRQTRGSIVLANGGVHVNKEARSAERTADSLEVRLDEPTTSADETRLLGIDVGDIIAFDPRFEKSGSGYVRSRFLDDKACVACALAAMKALKGVDVTPAQHTTLLFSVHEEVGHGGMDGLADDIREMLVLDMAALGEGQNGDEHHCSICVMDSSGPYSRKFSDRIRNLADGAGVDLKPDLYPYYGSDGSAYWRSGGRAEVALIGPGVDTSHGYERTHVDALRDTATLVAEYLVED